MTPDELRNALLHAPRTKEMLESIPKDAVRLAASSVTRANESARSGRYLRRLALTLCAVILFPFHPQSDMLSALLVIAAYEFAYGNAAKVRADLEDMQARERLRISVDEYLSEKFPGYVPPNEGFTLFHVSPYSK